MFWILGVCVYVCVCMSPCVCGCVLLCACLCVVCVCVCTGLRPHSAVLLYYTPRSRLFCPTPVPCPRITALFHTCTSLVPIAVVRILARTLRCATPRVPYLRSITLYHTSVAYPRTIPCTIPPRCGDGQGGFVDRPIWARTCAHSISLILARSLIRSLAQSAQFGFGFGLVSSKIRSVPLNRADSALFLS